MAPPPALDVEVQADSDTSAVTVLDRVTIEALEKRRTAAGKLVAGTAAAADVELFKGPIHHAHKPSAKRWDHRLTEEARNRTGNSLKGVAKYLKTPGIISLAGGLPSSEYFPYDSLSIKVPDVGEFSEEETHELGAVLTAGKFDLEEGLSLFDIKTAFNYCQGTGAAQFLRFIVEHTEMVHNPPYRDWHSTMTIGSTSALDMALRMFMEKGDYVITEEYSFASAVETAVQQGGRVVGVAMDEEGMLPEALDDLLRDWDEKSRGARKPFLLYTVPTGQNPTGATQSEQRRRALYRVAQKHDLYILEDDPYIWLSMQPYTGDSEEPPSPTPETTAEFLGSLIPPLLSMDVDGRVMRMDSLAKVIAPGARVGWITASSQIIDLYVKHADLSTQGPSGISQLVLFKLLDEHWGHEGFFEWLKYIRQEYTKRRDVILAASSNFLPREVLSWKPPVAGMFHWLQVDYTKHPSHGEKTIEEIEEDIFRASVRHGALVMKGSLFYADHDANHETMFFRTTYAAAPFGQINEAIRRFGAAVREEFKI